MNAMTRGLAIFLGALPAALLLACAPGVRAAPANSAAAPGATSPVPAHRRTAMPDTGVVRVTGSAAVSVSADRAHIRFAVETRAPEATDAAAGNARAMNAVLDAVRRELGEGGELSTEGYSLTPEYSRPEPGEPRSRRIVAYRAVNNVAVTLEELDRVAPVLDAAVGAGANRVARLSFVAGDTRAARLEAIREATARATEEAEILALALGGTLGPVIEVSVSPEDRGGGPVMRMAMMESADAGTPVEPGTREVQVTVDVSWRLDPGGR